MEAFNPFISTTNIKRWGVHKFGILVKCAHIAYNILKEIQSLLNLNSEYGLCQLSPMNLVNPGAKIGHMERVRLDYSLFLMDLYGDRTKW